MREHFTTTSRYEWMFWDAGYRRRPGRSEASGSALVEPVRDGQVQHETDHADHDRAEERRPEPVHVNGSPN